MAGSSNPRKSSKGTQVMAKDDRVIEFLKFPPEIRNQIYDLIFVKPSYIGSTNRQTGVSTRAFYKDASEWRNLELAMACHQVYGESANIFFAKNGFEFFYIRPFLEFLEAVGVQRRRLLTKLRYHQNQSGAPFIVCRYLKSCTGLQDLDIRARLEAAEGRFWWEYPMKDARAFFLGDKSTVEFETPRPLGYRMASRSVAPKIDGSAPFNVQHIGGSAPFSVQLIGMDQAVYRHGLNFFAASVMKVKQEQQGTYNRRDLPDVFKDRKHHACSLKDNSSKPKRAKKAMSSRVVDLTEDHTAVRHGLPDASSSGSKTGGPFEQDQATEDRAVLVGEKAEEKGKNGKESETGIEDADVPIGN